MVGGYKIIDLGGVDINLASSIKGLYKKIDSTDKAIMVSNYQVSGVDKDSVYAFVSNANDTYYLILEHTDEYIGVLEVKSDDSILYNQASIGGGGDVTKEYVDTELEKKQNTLTAGTNITISNNVISAKSGTLPNYPLQNSHITNDTYVYTSAGSKGPGLPWYQALKSQYNGESIAYAVYCKLNDGSVEKYTYYAHCLGVNFNAGYTYSGLFLMMDNTLAIVTVDSNETREDGTQGRVTIKFIG